MACFILVHGSWHGGWCWKKLIPLLRSAGHDVFAPSLTGLGERSHIRDRSIDLDYHINDIINLIETEELSDVILVGHSYGGMVITGVADRLHSRLRSLVYLDAHVPKNGDSIFDFTPASLVKELRKMAVEVGDGWLVPYPLNLREQENQPLYEITNENDRSWLISHLKPHPLACMEQKLSLVAADEFKRIKKYYIWCSIRQGRSYPLPERAKRAEEMGMSFFEIRTGHDAMITEPDALAQILLEVSTS